MRGPSARRASPTGGRRCHRPNRETELRALEEQVGGNFFDLVLCNENYEGSPGPASQWVQADEKSRADPRLYCADLIDADHPWRHDSVKLSQVLMDLFEERTGPLTDRVG